MEENHYLEKCVIFYPILSWMTWHFVIGQRWRSWTLAGKGDWNSREGKTVRVLYYEEDSSMPGQDLYEPMTSWHAYDYVPLHNFIMWGSGVSADICGQNKPRWHRIRVRVYKTLCDLQKRRRGTGIAVQCLVRIPRELKEFCTTDLQNWRKRQTISERSTLRFWTQQG